jgi:hypothetical protein
MLSLMVQMAGIALLLHKGFFVSKVLLCMSNELWQYGLYSFPSASGLERIVHLVDDAD